MRFKRTLLATILLFSLQVKAQDEAEILKYGPDKDLCEQNLSIYIEFISKKTTKMHINLGLICLTMRQSEQRTFIYTGLKL